MTAWSPINSNTAACGMARASRRCRLGGTSWSAVVITTAVGTSTSAIHSCEVNSTADSTADMAAGRLVLDSCARAPARDSPSWMRPSRLLPNHSAVIAGANGIRYSALFDKSRVGPEVVLYQRFSGGHDDGDVGDTGSDEFAHGVFDNRLVSDRQHLLRDGFRQRQQSGAKTGGGNHVLADRGRHRVVLLARAAVVPVEVAPCGPHQLD